jgi:hypothetical protein
MVMGIVGMCGVEVGVSRLMIEAGRHLFGTVIRVYGGVP